MTVRAKLIGLVVACVTPAVLGAVLQSNASRKQELELIERRVNVANLRFEEEMSDYQSSATLALTLTSLTPRFQKALEERDPARAERAVQRLAEVYKYRIIVAADAEGEVLARGNPQRGTVESLRPETSPAFAKLLEGKSVSGLIPLRLGERDGYAIVHAQPVLAEDKRVGSLAVFTPITDAYVEHLGKKLNADLAIGVDGKVVAATADHPAPDLRGHGEEVSLEEEGGHIFAVKTFSPKGLSDYGLDVDLTASSDVTAIVEANQRTLWLHLSALGAVLLAVLGFALRYASRLGGALEGISVAADQVKQGQYVNAPVAKTGDEVERLALSFNEMVQGLKERDRLRETFGRYVTRQVAEHLMKGNANLGGNMVPVTVLFSDIRSFTSISESMEPRALLDFLNEYFSGMVESVLTHHGVVDKFIGDAIMAVFGAPVPEPDDPLNAVKAALEMRQRLAVINEDFKRRGLPEIRTGIGLHSGQVVAGNMGHAERMEYTVIGDAVNLASRLEGMTKELACDVLMSEDLYKQVEAQVDAEPLGKITVKGRAQEVLVYRLIGLRATAAA